MKASLTSALVAFALTTTTKALVATPRQPQGTAERRSKLLSVLDVPTSHYVPMRSVTAKSVQGHPLTRRRFGKTEREEPPQKQLTNVHDVYYVIDLKVDQQHMPVLIDTGSSDTWFVGEPFDCVDFFYRPQPEEKCGFSTGYQGKFTESIPGLQFSRSYADGTFVYGGFGYADVSIGDITASHQQLGLVNFTYWYGDGITAGLLGLAYPLMTGLDGWEVPEYDPVFTTLWKNKLVAPMFSIALSRDPDYNNFTAGMPDWSNELKHRNDSFISFGGLPPVKYDDGTWERTPIQKMSVMRGSDDPKYQDHGLYLIIADGYVYGHQNTTGKASVADLEANGLVHDTKQFPVLIDVGATLSVLPRAMVERIYQLFDPPAEYIPGTGYFYARCDANIPKFGLQIGKQVFYMSPQDLLRQGARDDSREFCRVGVTDDEDGPWILGVSWLANVVSVFDVGQSEMRFAARTDY